MDWVKKKIWENFSQKCFYLSLSFTFSQREKRGFVKDGILLRYETRQVFKTLLIVPVLLAGVILFYSWILFSFEEGEQLCHIKWHGNIGKTWWRQTRGSKQAVSLWHDRLLLPWGDFSFIRFVMKIIWHVHYSTCHNSVILSTRVFHHISLSMNFIWYMNLSCPKIFLNTYRFTWYFCQAEVTALAQLLWCWVGTFCIHLGLVMEYHATCKEFQKLWAILGFYTYFGWLKWNIDKYRHIFRTGTMGQAHCLILSGRNYLNVTLFS